MESVQLNYVEAAGGFEASVAGVDGFGKTPSEAFEALALKLAPPVVEVVLPTSMEDAPAAEVASAPFLSEAPASPPDVLPVPPEVAA
jgi:hypothetical protein